MTLLPLTQCCLRLGIDPKTLRRWLKAAGLVSCQHPGDARLRCLTPLQLQALIQAHPRGFSGVSPSPATEQGASPQAQAADPPPDPSLHDLLHQVTSLQAQVRELTLLLTPLLLPASPVPPPGTTEATEPRAPRSRALPCVQVRSDGSLILVVGPAGPMELSADSAQWFLWLSGLTAFSFEGPSGHFSAARLRRHGHWTQGWNARRSLLGRNCSFYLGLTPTLTLAHLQQSATTVQERLKAL